MSRRSRQAKSYARREETREPYPFVLIVCEGSKTEPQYLHRLKIALGLSSANIKITPADGSDPVSVVRYAQQLMSDENYDKVFCVFDRDGHQNYGEAIQLVSQSTDGRSGKIAAITSWPCFELWLLLHFQYSTAPFTATGNDSACDKVLRKLKQHIPRYQKGYDGIYSDTSDHIAIAIKHAKQLQAHCQACNSKNPSTGMHELIEYLIGIKNGL